ncbi:ectonucleotide pyrophosphatase/phosphodiesterase [Formosa undariae]|uniref:Ectonucleotide pyrophosphatase/phosphodiesterase n=1 Tax=Formosa undariae TaxID=1325436 RepID=A0ABV5EYN7_9FLAO
MLSKNKISTLFFIALLPFLFTSCKTGETLKDSTITTNSKKSEKASYVILVSLDGFRWDYVEKYKPKHLSNFIKNGVQAESLIPSYPSKTFPNHYTIATGMYPENHGLIGNAFYSYKKDVTYAIRNREMVEDGSFYGGTPIWVLADQNNMVSSSYFYVGSEADIQGVHPTYYRKYDGKIKNETRISETLDWLKLPKAERPHILTIYFSDLDDIGHWYSPGNDEELKKAILKLDTNLGALFEGVADTGLDVNIIIVSDHGMTTVEATHFISIDDVTNTELYTVIDNGSILNIHPKNNVTVDSILNVLKPKENNFKVYRTENTPGFEYSPKNKDWGSIQIIPDFGYYFSSTLRIESMKANNTKAVGVHGYDTKYKDMHGIFYANGPAFKTDYTMPSFKNIDIYPLMCELLGLKIPASIDGNLDVIKEALK